MGVKRAGQPILGVIGDMQGIVEVFGFDYCQHGSEDLFLGDARMGVYVSDYGWFDEVAWAMMTATGNDAAFFFADLDVVGDLLHGVLINDRPHVGFWLGDIAECQAFRLLDDLL